MFCTQCGAEIIHDQAMFCSQCGAPTKRAETVQPQYEVPLEQLSEPVQQPTDSIRQSIDNNIIGSDNDGSFDESTTVLTADHMPDSLNDKYESLQGNDSVAKTWNQHTRIESGNHTEILDTPYVVNSTAESGGADNQSNSKSSGVLKWILIGGGALILLLIIVVVILVAVVFPRATSNPGNELADQDQATETTIDDLLTETEAVTTESTTTEVTTEVTTEAPPVLVSEISLDRNMAGILVDGSINISANILPAEATDPSVIWSSNNLEVAEVDASGNVIGKSVGNAIITCSAGDGGGVSAICNVIVSQTPSEYYVVNLYLSCLNRVPDMSEVRGWADSIDNDSSTPGQIAAAFCLSDELGSAELSDEDFIKVVYRTYLGREYDQEGLESWIGQMNGGMSREEVLRCFSDSDEFHQRLVYFGLEAPTE